MLSMNQLPRHLLRFLSPLVLVALGQAQDFNLDVGPNLILWPAPSSNYGAAAGQTGEWNAVKDPFAGASLFDLFGGGTSVSVSSNVSSSFSYPFGTLGSDDDAFTSDGQSISFFGPTAVWTFTGLVDGNYDVYTYAWAPENTGTQTDITITGDPGGTQSVGGVWNGSPHVQGVTYALHNVTVSGGTFSVEAIGTNQGDTGTITGFQLVQNTANSAAFCFGDGSGTACPCGNFGGSGEGCANSGGSGATLTSGGTTSASADDLLMSMAGAQGSTAALLFVGTNQQNSGNGFLFGDGLRCAGGAISRLGVQISNGNGDATWGPNLGVQGGWGSGDTRYFQVWYRDVNGSPCGNQFNLSHGLGVTFSN